LLANQYVWIFSKKSDWCKAERMGWTDTSCKKWLQEVAAALYAKAYQKLKPLKW